MIIFMELLGCNSCKVFLLLIGLFFNDIRAKITSGEED